MRRSLACRAPKHLVGGGIPQVLRSVTATQYLISMRTPSYERTTRYRCQRSGTPFSSCSPASSKVRPEPATRSFTVGGDEHLGWSRDRCHPSPDVDGDALDALIGEFDLAGVDARSDLDAELPKRGTDRKRAAYGSCRTIERGEEAVARRIAFDSSVGGQLSPDVLVVVHEQSLPGGIADLGRLLGGSDDVGEQHRCEHAIGLGYVANTCQEFLHLTDQRLWFARPREVVGAGQLDEATVGDLRGEQAVALRHLVLHPRTVEHQGRNVYRRQDGADVGLHIERELGFVAHRTDRPPAKLREPLDRLLGQLSGAGAHGGACAPQRTRSSSCSTEATSSLRSMNERPPPSSNDGTDPASVPGGTW